MHTATAAVSLRFGRFELQPHERRLLVDGKPAALGSRALDLLLVLAERAGQLVGRHALMDLVWPDVVVEDNNLAAQISALRKVLGGEVIATIPGRGYRFTARVDPSRTPLAGPQGFPGSDDAESGTDRASDLVTTAPSAVGAARIPDVAGGLAAPAPAAPPTNLPAELPALLGRSDDLAVLGRLIDQHRLVNIVGAGGMGKSLLAQHLLDARRGAYPHGVCWVELGPVKDAAALPGAIVAALGVNGGNGAPLAALVSGVGPLTLLLALDNAEHLLAEVAQLSQTLRDAAPGLRLLVTSQAPLNVAGEHIYRVGPLAVPQGPLPAAQALEYGAVALFTERAQAAHAHFSLTDANAAAVIELCRALDGLALAIELAAARAPMLGVQRLATSMQDRLKLLSVNRNRAAPARQQTLRAALEWSHGLLDAREQAVFRRLAVMAGSASLELIQRVVADPPGAGELDDWAVLDALGVLVDRSLVAVLPMDANAADPLAAPRYRLLDSPRAYALERLVAAGEQERLRQRHAQAVAAMFDAEWDNYFSGSVGDDDWLHRMSFDLDNARDALAWAIAAADSTCTLAIAATLLRALPLSLHAERMALVDRCEGLIDPAAPERLQQRAWVQLVARSGNMQRHRGHHAAVRALELARSLHGRQPDPFMLYLALCRFVGSAECVGQADAALAALEELRKLEDPTWPPQRLLYGTNVAACSAAAQGNMEDALRLVRRSIALDRARGTRLSWNDLNLVDFELAAGNAVAAATIGKDLVASLERARDEHTLTSARAVLAAALLALGDCAQARLVAQAGWPKAARFDMQPEWADYLALLAALEVRPQVAAQLMGYSDAAYRALDAGREGNAAVAVDRARALVLAALGPAEYDRLHAEGAALRDADIAPLAFGTA
jgi:predicted ATPase/DNA-binding winged helix-turn-helix (wHTH) protein